jgi:hypothetical protein
MKAEKVRREERGGYGGFYRIRGILGRLDRWDEATGEVAVDLLAGGDVVVEGATGGLEIRRKVEVV